MNKTEDLAQKTVKIDKLINKTNSGKNAWLAGSLMHEIKQKEEYKPKYTSFKKYLEGDLSISETKASNYILIYLTYHEEDISDTALQSHLILMTKYKQELREIMTKILKEKDEMPLVDESKEIPLFNEWEKESPKNRKKNNTKSRPSYDEEVVKMSMDLLDSADKSNIKITPELGKQALDTAIEIDQIRNIEKAKLPNKTGKRIESIFFPSICEMYEHEPVLEMGVVGLFCAMFHLLLETKFNYGGAKNWRLKSIIYVRNEFPDAVMKLINEKGETSLLQVEFELYTANYISHSHTDSEKECHLIIAWEDNLNRTKMQKFGKKIPPILSIKKLLETGKIELL